MNLAIFALGYLAGSVVTVGIIYVGYCHATWKARHEQA